MHQLTADKQQKKNTRAKKDSSQLCHCRVTSCFSIVFYFRAARSTASFKSMAQQQTVVHNLTRTYCKPPLATLECWCPEERTRSWGKSWEGTAEILQVQGPTTQTSPSQSAVLWPLSAADQGGQEAETSFAPAGQGPMRASHSIQQVVNRKQALTDAYSWAKNVAKTEAHSFLRHQRSRAKATTAHYFIPGRSCSQAGWQPLSPTILMHSQQAFTYSFPIFQSSCTRSLWVHSSVFYPCLTILRKRNKALLHTDCGYISLFMIRPYQG